MTFIDKVPQYVEQLNTDIKQLTAQRYRIDWGHDCDCEYCDRRGEGAENAEAEDARLGQEVKEHQRMIKRLQSYEDMFKAAAPNGRSI